MEWTSSAECYGWTVGEGRKVGRTGRRWNKVWLNRNRKKREVGGKSRESEKERRKEAGGEKIKIEEEENERRVRRRELEMCGGPPKLTSATLPRSPFSTASALICCTLRPVALAMAFISKDSPIPSSRPSYAGESWRKREMASSTHTYSCKPWNVPVPKSYTAASVSEYGFYHHIPDSMLLVWQCELSPVS